ncbi:gp53-like domain-containing protein [Rahnella sp. PAMC 25559]|uniref:gp53-like domain-containing protein n=1 Tax=Rahnella sp. PAMC 25559 TaxID=3423225 RepID=UPI003D6796A6
MQKIGDVTPTADINGEWTNGNVAAGAAPTMLDAAWLNSVQRELIAILSAAAIATDPLNDGQVINSLKKLFLQTSNNLSEIKTAGTAAQLSARANIAAAALAGLATQVFSVSTATANAHAVNLLQLNNAISALSLGNASTKTVGTGANQIPDMNSFTSSTTWFKLPSGKIVQTGVFSTTTSGNTIINFPVPFPTACRSIVATQQDTTFPNIIGCIPLGTTQFRTTTWNYNGGAVSGTSVAYIAIGD